MAELKTKKNDQSIAVFLDSVTDERKRSDSYLIVDLMRNAIGEEPAMWGDSIVGFGAYHYKYASGHEGDMPIIGFSPRKQNLTLYIWFGFESCQALLSKLGKHKTSKACLYINRLADVDISVLKEIIAQSINRFPNTNP